jgi:hypothetical protein
MRKQVWFWISLSGLILFVFSSFSCSNSSSTRGLTRLAYSWDLYNLAETLKNSYGSNTLRFEPLPDVNSLADLRSGKIDAVLLGREPAEREIAGLTDILISYDAVCIFVDQNSFIGGEYWLGRKTPVRKTIGLQVLSSEDLTRIFQYWILKPEERWQWYRYSWLPLFDPTKEVSTKDANGWFKETFEVPCSFKLTPGKYATQTVIYQKLGLEEKTISNAWSGYTAPKMDREEQVLAYEYMGDGYAEGANDYPFKIGFASRQVTLVALSHINIQVLTVNGINPLSETEHIYDGTYKFSRRIHLITRINPNIATNNFALYCRSQEGQSNISAAGYLALERGAN